MEKSPTNHHADNKGLDDDVGRLINLAGAREAVEQERFERVRANVHQHWQQVVAEQRKPVRQRHFRIMAVAASVLVIIGTAFMLSKALVPPPDDSLANVERIIGAVKIAGQPVNKETSVSANEKISTDRDGRIALRLAGGQSLRINSSSLVTVHTPNYITLDAGAIYIDTAHALNGKPIVVATPLGTAQDIGTQFQVQISTSKMVVGVRRGKVEVQTPGKPVLSIDKGFVAELNPGGQAVTKTLETDDPGWDWIETVTPDIDIEGATLQEFLQWYANERALDLSWASPASEYKAQRTILSGSVSDHSLEERLERVQQIAPFEFRVSDTALWVEVK